MAKTYTAAGSATAGDVYTASAHNVIVTNVNNFIVPPAVRVKRTSNLTGYTSATAITWQAEDFDTDGMWTSGSTINVNTAGIYVVTFAFRFTTATAVTFVEGNFGGSLNDRAAFSIARATDYRGCMTTTASLAVGAEIKASVEFGGGTGHEIDGTVIPTTLTATWIGRTS